MLLLFDIDGTMLSTGGAGMRSMVAAGRRVFGAGFTAEGVTFAGRLDPLIVRDMLERSGVRAGAEEMGTFYREYVEELRGALSASGGVALGGVVELLDHLAGTAATLAVLTGNIGPAGRLKLEACGIAPERFALHVWGDESRRDPPRRADLVEVAMERWGRGLGRRAMAEEVVVIGDTPGDVECAKAHGCRALAVATGHYGVEALRASGADLVVETLEGTAEVAGWLLARK